jgi:hypothetical protein
MATFYKVGDIVRLKTLGGQWKNDAEWQGKPLLVINVSQIAVGENVFNTYKVIHGTKTISNLRAYELDLLE